MIKVVLWDIDGTLLDFEAAEEAAIRTLFGKYSLGECTDEMLERYKVINRSFWESLERGEITKHQVLVGRYEKFFGEYGLNTDIAEAFNADYQLSLGDTIVHRDDCMSLLRALKGKVKQLVVSNGTVAAQTKKLRLSGIGEIMDGIYLSEEIGAEKPSTAFFEPVQKELEGIDRSEIMIIGDSLTSDMKGGNNIGIVTCWYNPHHKELTEDCKVDVQIADLHEVPALLEKDWK